MLVAGIDRCLTKDFEFRGQAYEIWVFAGDGGERTLVDPRKNEVVDTGDFKPPLNNSELLSIYDYGRDFT